MSAGGPCRQSRRVQSRRLFFYDPLLKNYGRITAGFDRELPMVCNLLQMVE